MTFEEIHSGCRGRLEIETRWLRESEARCAYLLSALEQARDGFDAIVDALEGSRQNRLWCIAEANARNEAIDEAIKVVKERRT